MLAIVGLDEGLALRIPAMLHHVLVDPVAEGLPAPPVGGKGALLGEPQGAIDRDPAHHLRVDEGTPPAPDLPDALVVALPVLLDPIDQTPELRPESVGDGGPVFVEEIDGVQESAGRVELELLVRVVADPHGP